MRRARGFTLLEVMVAVAITALMGTVVAMAFQTGMKAKETVETDADFYRQLRTATTRMQREVASAFVSDRYDPKRYRDQNDRPTNFIGERDKLTFTSFSNQRLYTDSKETDQVIIEYSVKTSPEDRSRNALMRRANPLIEERMDRGGTEDVLFDGIQKVEFGYWNSDRKEWETEWDTRRVEHKDDLPTRVRITIFAKDENGKERSYTTQARVMLNTVLPRY